MSCDIRVDLHIHSALSPCGDEFMTPGNIVGMAVVNGLDALAITDHNSSYNVPAALEIAKEYGIVLVPGMELETAEEIHIVCLFPEYANLQAFQEKVCGSYTPRENVIAIFGNQRIYNSRDEIVGEWEPMLLEPTGISIDDVFSLAEVCDGIAYPAHVDRDSYSVLSSFGMLPYHYPHSVVEISCECEKAKLLAQFPELKDYQLIRASDAHYHEKIQEEGALIRVNEKSPAGIIEALKNGRIIG